MREGEKSRMMNNNSADSSSPMKPKSVCIILLSQLSLATLYLSANWFGLKETVGFQHTSILSSKSNPLSLPAFIYHHYVKGKWNDSSIAESASVIDFIFAFCLLKCRYLVYFIFFFKDILIKVILNHVTYF